MTQPFDPELAIDAYLDGELDAEQEAALRAWLAEDPQRGARMLAERSLLHSRLARMHAQAAPADPATPTGRGTLLHSAAHFFTRRTPLSITVAALVIGLLITAMAFIAAPIYRHLAGPGREPGKFAPPVIVAELSGVHEAVWGEGQIGSHRGAQLPAGHSLHLNEGIVEVTLSSGAVLVIEAPAVVRIDGPNRCSLETGQLVARVPAAAIGFSIATPNCEVVDLGTEFGVDVTGERSGVQVFEGSVALVPGSGPSAPSQRRVLVAGEAVLVDQSGLVEPAKLTDMQSFRRHIPAAPQWVDVTPEFVGKENCSRVLYTGIGRATEIASLHVYDAAVGSRNGNQYVWLDLSASLPQLPPERIERVLLRWDGVVVPQVVPAHGSKAGVQAELGVFTVPDGRRGIPTVFARADGKNNVNFYAAHESDVIDAVTVPAVSEDRRILASWDITKLVQHWIDNPEAPHRGQLVLINRQHPVWVQWDGTPRVLARIRPHEESDAKASDESEPPRQAAPQDDLKH